MCKNDKPWFTIKTITGIEKDQQTILKFAIGLLKKQQHWQLNTKIGTQFEFPFKIKHS
jgi:hypothetical protein